MAGFLLPTLSILCLIVASVTAWPIPWPNILSTKSSINDESWIINPGEIPQYVTEYAPVVHLWSEEKYLPYDIKSFVSHFYVKDNFDQNITTNADLPLKLAVLGNLTALSTPPLSLDGEKDTSDLFLTALDNFNTDPDWITGMNNVPDIGTGYLKNAPAVLIVVDKGDGWVDAFWFYFYSYNLGPFVMGAGPYGNHVGDWEHSLVRFHNGVPQIVWMSAHGGGSAYHFDAMEKSASDQKRPVLFSARGTHANYAAVGQHSHDIPYYILSDFTDRGPLWDPAQNCLAYTFDGTTVTHANGSHPGREETYGDWLNFAGHWGDKKLSPDDPKQEWHVFEWKYIDGPLGPLSKNLLRSSVCQRSKWWNFWGECRIRTRINNGEGYDAEGYEGCGAIFSTIRPVWLRWILWAFTWRGYGCTIIDRFL
ncbi:hypothetical protein NADFUDRAFT_53132 [Nadsonia fulvescens var. elongata DSM 6958]|uniref:Vacuolar protein sorting-associated protein 62 n=1 Tax=Nadsonia fulvescens var. elongata DSM 6958 TaxID=857566 RepID=A0A1E3PDG4_9ASCO|nr:hypothetical protein NADFUDRAFT_53132 [Nadsonia fulvescens var. elongata DSM 6958]